jgi:hypothetical protein
MLLNWNWTSWVFFYIICFIVVYVPDTDQTLGGDRHLNLFLNDQLNIKLNEDTTFTAAFYANPNPRKRRCAILKHDLHTKHQQYLPAYQLLFNKQQQSDRPKPEIISSDGSSSSGIIVFCLRERAHVILASLQIWLHLAEAGRAVLDFALDISRRHDEARKRFIFYSISSRSRDKNIDAARRTSRKWEPMMQRTKLIELQIRIFPTRPV